MSQTEKIAALIVAAGGGTRMGGGTPKQFRDLGGRPMLAWSHDAFRTHPAIATVLTMVGGDQFVFARPLLPPADIAAGGASRRESVALGLRQLALEGVTKVLIHDAARPFLSHDVIDRVLAGLASADGAMPVLPVADTLHRATQQPQQDTNVQPPAEFAVMLFPNVLRHAHSILVQPPSFNNFKLKLY